MDDVEFDYRALTVDTSVFDQYGIALEKGLLKQLTQFKGGPVQFILSEIVLQEMRAHLIDKIAEARNKVETAIRHAGAQFGIADAEATQAAALLVPPADDAHIAERRLAAFYDATDAETVDVPSHVDLAELVVMYFEARPPFERSGKKKSEFPDALALLSIEAWAENADCNVLVVSTDGGWRAFAEESPRLTVVESLAEAIAFFQPHRSAQGLLADIQVALASTKPSEIATRIEAAIRASLEEAEIHADASSGYYFEEDEIVAEYRDHDWLKNADGQPQVSLIRVEAGGVVVKVAVNVACDVYGSFSFSVWDSEDREYVGIGNCSCTVPESYETELLITLTGTFPTDLTQLEVGEVEVLHTLAHAGFGAIEPDWGGPDD